jgi:hypothetical protein
LQAKNLTIGFVKLTGNNLAEIRFADTCKVLPVSLVIFLALALSVINSVWANDSLHVQNKVTYYQSVEGYTTNLFLLESTELYITYSTSQQNSVLRRRRSMVREQALGVGANLLGPTLGYASAYLQYSYGRVIQMEAGLDLSTVYTGINLYPHIFGRIEELSPYMGLMIGYSDPLKQNIAKGIYAYMPIGLRYITSDDWYVCVEIAATTASTVQTAPLFLGIKLGYLFKR